MRSGGKDYWTLADEAERAATQAQTRTARQQWQKLAAEYRTLAKLKQGEKPE